MRSVGGPTTIRCLMLGHLHAAITCWADSWAASLGRWSDEVALVRSSEVTKLTAEQR